MKMLFLIVCSLLASSIAYAPPTFPAASLYIATTGSDVTGNGSMAAPWATLLHALQALPRGLDKSYTINVADGTYAEGVCIAGTVSPGDHSITVLGDLSSMDSVVFSGTCSYTAQRAYAAGTSGAYIPGPGAVNLEGMELTGGSATFGLFEPGNATVQLEHVDIETTGNKIGIEIRDGAQLGLLDTNTVNVTTLNSTLYDNIGLEALYGARCWYVGLSGTPTILIETGSGGTASSTPFIGLHVGYGSQVIAQFSSAVAVTLELLNTYYGVQLGLSSVVQMSISGSTMLLSNPGVSVNKMDGSSGILGTDNSSFSVNSGQT